jgi:hypothetical protein
MVGTRFITADVMLGLFLSAHNNEQGMLNGHTPSGLAARVPVRGPRPLGASSTHSELGVNLRDDRADLP